MADNSEPAAAKVIGLLGGMSWPSTITYYREINKAVQARLGGSHSARLVISSDDYWNVERMQLAGEWEAAGEWLAEAASRLEGAGAEIIAIACNTMHKVADSVTRSISVTFVDLIEAAASEAKHQGCKRTAILGTEYTLRMGRYTTSLRNAGIEPLEPDDADASAINELIYKELCLGRVTNEGKQLLSQVIERLAQAGADSVLLACTELNLLVDCDRLHGVQILDATRIHIDALVEASLSGDGNAAPVSGSLMEEDSIPNLADLCDTTSPARAANALAILNRRGPELRRRIASSEASGRLPDDVAEELIRAGVTRLLTPKAFGGLDLEAARVLHVLEELARVSGSLGWIAMIGCETPVLLSLFPRKTFEELYRDGPDVFLASSAIPCGKADKTAEGWQVSGRWPFTSGSAHCQLVMVHSKTEDGGAIATLHSREDVIVHEDWRALGLRATSSGSVELVNAIARGSHSFVPASSRSNWVGRALAAPVSEHFGIQMAAIAIGILRHAIEVTCATAARPTAGKRKFEDAGLATALGEAETFSRVGRAALREALGDLLSIAAQSGSQETATCHATLAVARHVVEGCVASTGRLFDLSGSSAIFDGNELQECLRDLRTLSQHANVSPGRFAQLGTLLMRPGGQ